MIGCSRTRVRKQPIIALYFESETGLKFYNLEAMDFGNILYVDYQGHSKYKNTNWASA